MKLSPIGCVSAAILFSVSAASAAPLTAVPAAGVASSDQAQIVQVRGGCGFGEHRGPYGGCRINDGPRGALRAAVTGLPGGCPPGQHRGPYGRCHF